METGQGLEPSTLWLDWMGGSKHMHTAAHTHTAHGHMCTHHTDTHITPEGCLQQDIQFRGQKAAVC